MRRLGRVLLRVLVGALVIVTACAISGVLVVRSGWFRERVRERIIGEIEKMTGGRAELGSFAFDWTRLTATVTGLVLHGKEPAGDPPLLTVNSVTVGLRVISMFERKVDLSYLRVEQPRMRIVFYPDGSNNLLITRANWAEGLLSAAVGRYEVNDGLLDYDQRRIPVNIRGENLRAAMRYDARGRRYRGELESRAVRVMAVGGAPIGIGVSASFAIERTGIEITALRLSTRSSHADLSGRLNDPQSPHGTLRVKAAISVGELAALFAWPVTRTGNAAFDGQISLSLDTAAISGRVVARGIGYTRDRLKIEGADFTADVRLSPNRLALSAIRIHALDATIEGAAELKNWSQFHFDGNVGGLNVREAAAMVTPRTIRWNGTIAAGFALDATLGEPTAKLEASIAITPAAGGTPLEGQIEATYDQAAGKVRLGNSHLATSATRLDVSGTLGETLDVRAQSSNLDDVLPALALAEENAPKELPIKLHNGRATFSGRISGPFNDPRLSGQATVQSASVEGHAFDRFSGQIEATTTSLRIDRAAMARGPTQINGSAEVTKTAIEAQLNVRNAQIAELAKEAGVNTTVTGTASGTAHLSGAPQRPDAEITVDVEKPAGFGEQLDRLRATFRYSAETITVTAGEADLASARLHFEGDYKHRANDWKNGDAKFAFVAEAVPLSAVKAFSNLQTGVDSKVDAKANGVARIAQGELTITSIDGNATAHAVTWDRQGFGDIAFTAETRGDEVALRAAAEVRDISVQAQGSWRFSGEMPGTATVRFSRANLATVHNIVMTGGPLENTALPFEGFIDGASAMISIALRKPRDFHAELTVGTLEIHPKPTETLRLGVQAQDIALRNAKPVVVEISSSQALIKAAQFAARDTDLEATGTVAFNSKTGSDLSVKGSVNLIILQLLNPDLVARGSATVQASVRGSLRDPQLSGRMELKNASLYLGDLPNGIDNANGAVAFDRNRATIEKLTAETGGGTINLGGFIGFGSPLVYRLQATVAKVRVRYPEDVSVTFDATLALNGTSEASTVSGLMTLTRASFTPRADLARIVAQAARPIPAPATSSDYIRGMQFDVHIESGPGFELQTSLTRNLEAEVDLRLRGTPLRPALLGSASVNEGEVQMFGNRYTVNRGDIRFVNPVKVDPILDMDLETKARGVTVNIAISGTLQKLNVNYSSDPPMQPREIIALLAVGRTPADNAGLSSESSAASSSSLAEAGGGLISQAITAQLSSRLQRFFGASRVKIDPTLTGVEYLPQARLTIEQQVSSDITLTYITNLNRTQEQIVQVEYDFSRQWSAIATREANGLFGVDFQYRKRFK